MTGQEAENGHGSMVLLDVGTACHALLDSAGASPSLEDAGFYNACSSRCEAHTFPGVRPMGHRRCRICKKRPVWKGGDVKNPGPVCKKCYHKHVWRERTAQAKAREEEPIKRRSRPQTPWPSPAGPVSSGEELLAWFEEPPEDLASSLCDTALMAVRDHWALVVSIIRDQSTSTQMIESHWTVCSNTVTTPKPSKSTRCFAATITSLPRARPLPASTPTGRCGLPIRWQSDGFAPQAIGARDDKLESYQAVGFRFPGSRYRTAGVCLFNKLPFKNSRVGRAARGPRDTLTHIYKEIPP